MNKDPASSNDSDGETEDRTPPLQGGGGGSGGSGGGENDGVSKAGEVIEIQSSDDEEVRVSVRAKMGDESDGDGGRVKDEI